MGATDSKQKLGERVLAARKKLENDMKIQSERVKDIEIKSPATLKVTIESVAESFRSCSPFLEPTLLVAWKSDPEKCQNIILHSCKKVLSAPIVKEEYEWFMKYVFPSSIWFLKAKQKNRFMFEELMDIANDMQTDIIHSMNSIYNHLEFHPQWKQLLDIKNKTVVSRQDDKKVGALQQKGIKNILETKQNDDIDNDDLQSFIDGNLAVNILTSTAKNINEEFQHHIETVMSKFGDFKSGPIKKVDRCLSKLENDYQDAAYPKSAKLLDLVRCSVTFNTVNQLITGFDGLMGHIGKNESIIELSRIKNGFLDKSFAGGYRDIKLNVIYHSPINPKLNMICEIQLILNQYLHEKKRIHKLYSIIRQQLYFKMTVAENDEKQSGTQKSVAELKFEPILKASDIDKTPDKNGKCSVNSELGLLAMENLKQICCVDIKKKKVIFTQKRTVPGNTNGYSGFSHSWIEINKQKYLSVQTSKNVIKFLKIENNSFVETKKLQICLDEDDSIYCCEFDKTFENIILIKNGNILEKRVVNKKNTLLTSIKLDQKIQQTNCKMMSLSNDGNWCIVGCGKGKSYFYLIDIDKKKQHKVTSTNLKNTRSVCFINGNPEFCMVGGRSEDCKMELWDTYKRVSIKVFHVGNAVNCLTSTKNVLAVGTSDKKLGLWDVQTWKMFWSQKYDKLFTTSVDLTNDLKYLTVGGWFGEKCMILDIK